MKLLRWIPVCFAIVVAASAAENVVWMNDLAAAKAKAAAEHKPLVIDFTGSRWCPPCKALHKAVFTSPEFATFSQSVVLVALDYPPQSERTPEKVKANPALAALMQIKAEYGVPGFPTVFYYDAAGKPVSKLVGYTGESPDDYLAKLTGATK